MKVILPIGIIPIVESLYEAINEGEHGFCRVKDGLRAGFDPSDGHECHANPVYRLQKDWYYPNVQIVSETTDWFSTAEFVPLVEGWYECRVKSGVTGEEHPKPYLYYWDGVGFLPGGNSFNIYNCDNNIAFLKQEMAGYRKNALYFRGIQHQWKEKN